MLLPKVIPLVESEVGIEITQNIKRRLDHFVTREIEKQFEPLLNMRSDDALVGISKGVAYRIIEDLGLISRNEISADIKALEQKDRALLRKHGLRFGQFTIFHYLMLKPAPTKLRLLLWSVFANKTYALPPPAGLVTIPKVEVASPEYYLRAGYKLVGDRALRVDMLERLADLIRTKDVWNGFEADVDMLSITGLTLEQFAEVLGNLGYSAQKRSREKILRPTENQVQSTKVEMIDASLLKEKNSLAFIKPSENTPSNRDSKPNKEITTNEIGEIGLMREEDVYYVFKLQKKSKPKPKINSDSNYINEKKKGNGNKKNSNFNKNQMSSNKSSMELKIKKEKPIDPDNPFLALLKLKNKL